MAGTTRTAEAVISDGTARAGGNGTRRTIRGRRALPGGRAVLGGLLVAVAAVGTFAAYGNATAGPSTSYAVATADLPAGHRVEPADLELRRMDLPASVAGRAFTSADAVVGAVTLAPLAAGELVQAGALVPPGGAPAPAAELSFAVPVDRAVNGTLRPGERVDVLATYGTGGAAHTMVVVRGALLLADDEGEQAIGASTRVLTLALEDPDDVVRVTHAVRAGEVTVVRATTASGATGTIDDYRPGEDG
ncbi:MAG TPA: SAF domain-containing protein [Acidimicrobiales bacterium]